MAHKIKLGTLSGVALACFMFGLLELSPLTDLDLLSAIRMGAMMLADGTLLHTERLLFLLHGNPASHLSWFAQVIFAALYQLGSWDLVRLAGDLVSVAAFVITYFTCRTVAQRDGGSVGVFSAVLAVLLGFLCSLSNLPIRPQSFMLPGFALLLWLLNSRLSPLVIGLLMLPLGVLWQNLHPSLTIGIAAGVVTLAGQVVARDGDRRLGHLAVFALVFAVLYALQLATPDGADFFKWSAANVEISRELLGVSEWLPPWNSAVRDAMWPFWGCVVLSLVAVLTLRTRLSIRSLIPCLAFGALTLYAARFAIFWALVMIPYWSLWIEELNSRRYFAWAWDQGVRFSRASAVAAFALVLTAGVWMGRPAALNPSIPAKAIERLKLRYREGRVYNYREWAGPLVLLGSPHWQLLIDGRLYLYTISQWKDYYRAALGEAPVEEIEQRYAPDFFFLHPQFNRGLIERLAHSSRWRKSIEEPELIVFEKTGTPA